MTPFAVITTVLGYIAVLFVVAWLSGRRADDAGYFTGNRGTPWYMAAFAMIGAAISGVTFISVPGSVAVDSFSYMQMVAGFTVGQLVVAFLLIPTFYRLRVVCALRIPQRALRHPLAPYRGMVLLRVEDAGCRAACLRGLRRHATAGFQPLRAALLAQCAGDDALRLALYAAGGCQVAHLDGYAARLSAWWAASCCRSSSSCRRSACRSRRNDPRGRRVALFAGVFLRRPLLRPLFLEDVSRRASCC